MATITGYLPVNADYSFPVNPPRPTSNESWDSGDFTPGNTVTAAAGKFFPVYSPTATGGRALGYAFRESRTQKVVSVSFNTTNQVHDYGGANESDGTGCPDGVHFYEASVVTSVADVTPG